jgi:ribose transport system ATP-binding protein
LLLDDPTVGMDIAAKAGITRTVRKIANEGGAILIASSELDEMARVADRVLVLKNGSITKELRRSAGDEISERILTVATQE